MDQLGLGAAELLQLARELGGERGVVERQADLVGRRLEERHLLLGERVRRLPAERERSEDPVPRPDGDGDEALDPLRLHHGARGGQEVRRCLNIFHHQGAALGRRVADQPLAEGKRQVHVSEPGGEAPVTPEDERVAVGSEEVEGGELVPRHLREGRERFLQDLLKIKGAADRRRHGAEDGQMPADRAFSGTVRHVDADRTTYSWTRPSAASSLEGSLPPAWARSGRPPPPPPTARATSWINFPALKRGVRSFETAATRFTLSSFTLPRQITPEPSRSRTESTTARSPSWSSPSTRAATTATPPIWRAAATRSWARLLARRPSMDSSCFSSNRCPSSSFWRRWGSSSGGILSSPAASRSAGS